MRECLTGRSGSILFDDVHVGAGAQLHRCIVDKQVQIPPGECIGFNRGYDEQRFVVSENGVVVIPKEYQFPSQSEPDSWPLSRSEVANAGSL